MSNIKWGVILAWWSREMDLVKVMNHAMHRVKHRAVWIVLAAAVLVHEMEPERGNSGIISCGKGRKLKKKGEKER